MSSAFGSNYYELIRVLPYITDETWNKYRISRKSKKKTLFKKCHLESSFKDPGMTVMESYPFITASTDLEVQCQCYGPRLVEIKCPASIIGQIPYPENYDHIEVVDDTLSLKRSSPYFS